MYKVVKKLIDDALVGVDVYTKDGEVWFIFTNEKKWVFELLKNGNLYYYYPFFKNLFSYLSLDVVENEHYITKWVEDTIQNGVKRTYELSIINYIEVEDTIQNGVKDTQMMQLGLGGLVDTIIKNGVKRTGTGVIHDAFFVENIINIAVKHTTRLNQQSSIGLTVDDVIEGGVKDTRHTARESLEKVKDTLQNGIKHTNNFIGNQQFFVENTIQNGIKLII
jgi:hypothetical protein